MTPTPIIPKADEVCPFCGKDPLFLELAATGFGSVYCGNPSCPAHPETSGYDDVDVSGLSKAKTLWNTRAPSPAVSGEVMSDEIDQSLRAVHGDHYPSGMHQWEIEEARKDMRAALEAFVRGRGK